MVRIDPFPAGEASSLVARKGEKGVAGKDRMEGHTRAPWGWRGAVRTGRTMGFRAYRAGPREPPGHEVAAYLSLEKSTEK